MAQHSLKNGLNILTFSVTILGNNAALPGIDSITSAQIVAVKTHLYLFDCGEGCQMKLQKFKIKRNKINAVFISHLHGDHLFGLPGLITSYAHFQRKAPLTIVGPIGIKRFLETAIELSQAYIDFDIQYIELQEETYIKVYEDKVVEVYAFPLRHRILTFGFKVVEKISQLKIRPEKIMEYNLSHEQIRNAKQGLDIETSGGQEIKNSELVYDIEKPRSYAYCSDTMYDERLVDYVKGVDVLYHEATYLNDMQEQAIERMHSTVKDACMIAKMAECQKLILGHFSTRYGSTDMFLSEGKDYFQETYLTREGLIFEVIQKKNKY